jgi:anaerobic magnesium-protoporphyrin IX monomethyl ester cyclase
MIDVVFIAPNNANSNYQKLAAEYSAIEPPTWALMLAESCRRQGFKCAIIDTLAERITDEEVVYRISQLKPRIICFVVYGQNVNAGSTSMEGAIRLTNYIKEKSLKPLVGFVGSHVQALPRETLEKETGIDFAFLNEGVTSLHNILRLQGEITVDNLFNVTGLILRSSGGVVFTGKPELVEEADLERMLPGYAWDLLPYDKFPLDLYRSPYWHADYIEEFRSPYASIQTSLGCKFKCSFCMINLINKSDENERGIASNYNMMRHWPVDLVVGEVKRLIELGVYTIRITDEMFLLNRKYYIPLIDKLIELNIDDKLRFWSYSRIDTVPSPEILAKLRKAGFRWLCLGIESGNRSIRLEVAKGKFQQVDVHRVVKQIEDAGINVMANYIFGLPGDTEETVNETFDLSVELNTLGWNTYAAMALPGSALYEEAKASGIRVPSEYNEFSFHAYETVPLPTKSMAASEVLRLRDEKFTEYFSRTDFLMKIERNFGASARTNIMDMVKVSLRRKIIEENQTTGRE